MKTILYVANLIVDGKLDIRGAIKVSTSSQEVEAIDSDGRYTDYVSVDAERLGPDAYTFELDSREYTVEELQDYINGTHSADLAAYEEGRRNAVARVSELIEQVSPLMNELLLLANEYNIPANIKVGKHTNDFRLIDAVDWDSSSMYC